MTGTAGSIITAIKDFHTEKPMTLILALLLVLNVCEKLEYDVIRLC